MSDPSLLQINIQLLPADIQRLLNAGRRQAATGGPRTERQRSVGGGASSGAFRIACCPSSINPVLTPSEHAGRSARKPHRPQPVGAARSGRSLLNGVQPLSGRPGIDSPALSQGRSRGTRTPTSPI